MKVLVIEDDNDLSDIIRRVLGDEGFDVCAARNGQEALELLERIEAPNLILLDLMMPVMDGWAFRVRQLANPRFAAIPAVVMTASQSLDDAAIDGAGLIRKPVHMEELLTRVRQHARPESNGGGIVGADLDMPGSDPHR